MKKWKKLWFVILFVLFGLVIFIKSEQHISAAPPKTLVTIPQKHHKSVCGLPGQLKAKCHAHVVTDENGTPLGSGAPSATSFGPVQFHTAYNLPCTPNGKAQSICTTPSSFGPQTIAIVDAYTAPNIENDLVLYSNYYGIAPCTRTNGCLTTVNQNGGSALPVIVDSGWALETSLDVEVAHAICQTCKILLVETNSNSMFDLATGVQTAANFGATAISNSYGGGEWPGETSYDSFFNHPGIAITASSGDSGYGAEFPAASPFVVATGGTTLQLFTDNTYFSETAWSGTGSGCSTYEVANSWQLNLSNWALTGCGARRSISDVSADADPSSGAAVYDSTPYNGSSGWWQVGGTSLSSPLIAATFALTGTIAPNTNAASILYKNFNPTNSHDITSGSNGACPFFLMCNSATNYDGPTGLGTPNGITGFGGIQLPLDTPTPTQIPTPTATPSPTLTPSPTPIDTAPPTVTITSPLNGSTVRRNTNVTIRANASDNVAVTKVEFSVNNNLICTSFASPYSCVWRVPIWFGITYTLTAKAYDAAGNSSTNSISVRSR